MTAYKDNHIGGLVPPHSDRTLGAGFERRKPGSMTVAAQPLRSSVSARFRYTTPCPNPTRRVRAGRPMRSNSRPLPSNTSYTGTGSSWGRVFRTQSLPSGATAAAPARNGGLNSGHSTRVRDQHAAVAQLSNDVTAVNGSLNSTTAAPSRRSGGCCQGPEVASATAANTRTLFAGRLRRIRGRYRFGAVFIGTEQPFEEDPGTVPGIDLLG